MSAIDVAIEQAEERCAQAQAKLRELAQQLVPTHTARLLVLRAAELCGNDLAELEDIQRRVTKLMTADVWRSSWFLRSDQWRSLRVALDDYYLALSAARDLES